MYWNHLLLQIIWEYNNNCVLKYVIKCCVRTSVCLTRLWIYAWILAQIWAKLYGRPGVAHEQDQSKFLYNLGLVSLQELEQVCAQL